jgi:hypothetical protein
MGKVMTRIKIMGQNKFVLRVLGGSRYLSFYPSIHLTYTAGWSLSTGGSCGKGTVAPFTSPVVVGVSWWTTRSSFSGGRSLLLYLVEWLSVLLLEHFGDSNGWIFSLLYCSYTWFPQPLDDINSGKQAPKNQTFVGNAVSLRVPKWIFN